ncbi:thiopeptide-type bacteriocin biosynthesis protein [Micromonospora sp. CA-263727]|uniref:thiopeptide-type bacteriocin biosynthesis protein n=1 Tax=Micromonospora sp. CA-263727 TaxID=3239967 RepID=UPI003D8BEC29
MPESAVLALLTGTPASTAAAHAAVPVAELIEAAERYQDAGRAALTTRAAASNWYQANLVFPDRGTAERTMATLLGPKLRQAQASGTTASWWYIRKTPYWRLRLRADQPHPEQLRRLTADLLDPLTAQGSITTWSTAIYEPETWAFGGPTGMEAAHHFFHADSTHILTYLNHTLAQRDPQPAALGRRELSLLLCTALLRAADQDWHEQGDVWHRVQQMRPLDANIPRDQLPSTADKVHRILTLDTEQTDLSSEGHDLLDPVRPWLAATNETGEALRNLAHTGVLRRGLRDVLAHHVIFHWNRLGLTTPAQAILAHCASTVILHTGSPPAQA